MSNSGRFWYNFKTLEYDYLEQPETDEDALMYIAQEDSAQLLYQLYRKMGESILESMVAVLRACLVKLPEKEIEQ